MLGSSGDITPVSKYWSRNVSRPLMFLAMLPHYKESLVFSTSVSSLTTWISYDTVFRMVSIGVLREINKLYLLFLCPGSEPVRQMWVSVNTVSRGTWLWTEAWCGCSSAPPPWCFGPAEHTCLIAATASWSRQKGKEVKQIPSAYQLVLPMRPCFPIAVTTLL